MDGRTGRSRGVGDPVVITAEELAGRHTSLWRRLVPMLDGLVRTINTHPRRFDTPMASERWAHRRAFIAEIAFLQFVGAHRAARDHGPDLIEVARGRVARLTGRTAESIGEPVGPEPGEATELSRRLTSFFARRSLGGPIIPHPQFRGCGMVGTAEGDVLVRDILYEVKSVNRTFRAVDLRQLLVYCALNHAGQTHLIRRIGLINPLQGTWEEWDSNEFSLIVSGQGSSGLLRSLVEYMGSDVLGIPDDAN